jgi:hypothetical protein
VSGEAIVVPRGGRAWIESPPPKESSFVEWPWLLVGIALVAIKIVVMTSKTPVWLTLKKGQEHDDDLG